MALNIKLPAPSPVYDPANEAAERRIIETAFLTLPDAGEQGEQGEPGGSDRLTQPDTTQLLMTDVTDGHLLARDGTEIVGVDPDSLGGIDSLATTVARDALSPATDEIVFNEETGRFERYNGSQWLSATETPDSRLYAESFGAVPATPRLASPSVNSWGALNASLLSMIASVDPPTLKGILGIVSSASNNDSGAVTLTKTSSGVVWTNNMWATVLASGTVTSAPSTTSIADSGAAYATNAYTSAILRFTSGNHSGKCVNIATNTATTIGFPWQELLVAGVVESVDVGSTFEIIDTRPGGTAYELCIVGGKGKGQWAIIVDNTDTKLWLDRPFATSHIPDSTSRFRINPARSSTTRFVNAPVVWPPQMSLVEMAEFGHLDGAAGCIGPAIIGAGESNIGTWLRATGGQQMEVCTNVSVTDSTLTDSAKTWTVDQWKDRYLVLWDPHYTRRALVRIVRNTSDTLYLEQTGWGSLTTGAISVVTNQHFFRSPNFDPVCNRDSRRFQRVRITTKDDVTHTKYVASNRVDGGDCGDFTVDSNVATTVRGGAVTSITSAAGTATVTTTAVHGRVTGDWVYIYGANETEYNGWVQITVTGVSTFTYAVSGAPASPATGTIIAGDRVLTDVAPSANWYYAIAEQYVLEMGGTTQHLVKNLTIEPSSTSEVLAVYGHSWRRAAIDAGVDHSIDPRRCNRSSSDNKGENINIGGVWVHAGIMLGNFLKRGVDQVDNTRLYDARVQGGRYPYRPDLFHHWENGIIAGGGSFGNALVKQLFAPVVILTGNGIVNAYDDLHVFGSLVQTNENDFLVHGTQNFCVFDGGRSEGSRRLYYAPSAGALSQNVRLIGQGFKQDGAEQLPGGDIIYSNMQGDLAIVDCHAVSGFSSPNEGVITARDAGGTWVEADNTALTFSYITGQLDPHVPKFKIVITTGTGIGQVEDVNTVVVTGSTVRFNTSTFSTIPGVGATFEIVDDTFAPISGTFTDNADYAIGAMLNISETWTDYNGQVNTWGHVPNRHDGRRLIVTSGALSGTTKLIDTNSRDRLSMQSGEHLGSAPASGDSFIICQAKHGRIHIAQSFGLVDIVNFGCYSPKNSVIYQTGGAEVRVQSYGRHNEGNAWVEGYHGGHRYDVDGWYYDDVASGLTDQTMTRVGGPAFAPNVWIAPEDGQVLGFWVKSGEARSGGTLTVKIFKNGVAMTSFQYTPTVSATLDATNTTFHRYQAQGWMDLEFDQGDMLDLRITTDGSWAPSTADLGGGISIELHR